MSKKKLSGKALVVQITREEIRIAQMRLGLAKPEIQASVIIPTPVGAVEDGEIRNLTALKDAMRPALEDPVFRRTRRTVFVLCSSRVISETTRLPAKQKGKRLEQVLQANMDEYFPVQTDDYLLTWEHGGYVTDDGFRESLIQLWAVPRAMVSRYYELAAGLGLTIAAIDYCGNAAAAAAGLTFAAARAAKKEKKAAGGLTLGRKKKQESDAEPDSGDAVAVMEEPSEEETAQTTTDENTPVLYLHIDDDSIITTFALDGQVKLQRLVQRGFSLESDLGETAISLEYFNALPETPAPVGRAVLSGSAVGEAEEWNLSDLLGIPTEMLDCLPDPSWALTLGASRTKLDFGIPDLSRDGSETKLWQFVLVFAGGAAVVGAVLIFMTSSLTWSTELGGLRNTQNQLMILAQQNAGAAQAYNEYSGAYDAYSSDWESVYGSVRTYNDNLVLILEELEDKLPTSATVTTFNMTDQSVSAQVAFKGKKDVAYFLQSLRDMRYANLEGISSLSIGPYYTQASLRAQQQASGADASAALAGLLGSGSLGGADAGQLASLMALAGLGETAPTEGGDAAETPPAEGSNAMMDTLIKQASGGEFSMDDMDMDTMMPILVKANGGEPLDIDDVVRYATLMDAVESGNLSEVDPATLTDILNAMDEDNNYSQSDVETMLTLLGSYGGLGNNSGLTGGSGENGKYTEEDVRDMIEANGDSLSNFTDAQIRDMVDAFNGANNRTNVLSQLLEAQNITVKQLRLNLQNLDKSQLNVLQNEYAVTGDATRYDEDDLEDLLKGAERDEREKAIRSLLHNDPNKMDDDPAAMYRFFLLLQEDKEQSTSKQVVYDLIEDGIMAEPDMHRMLYQSTQAMLNRHLEDLVDLLVKNRTNLNATEKLILSDDKLAGKYAAHLARAMGKVKTVDTSIDMEQILKDLETADILNNTAKVQEAVLSLLPESTRGLYLAAAKNTATGTGTGTGSGTGSTGGVNLGNLFGSQTQPIQAELRYFITVSMSYDETLIQAEQARKGLDYTQKVSRLEVSR